MSQANQGGTGASTIERIERPLFIVGSPRSGTGLLRNLVRSHPRISIPGESHFIPHFYESHGDPANADEAIQLGRKIVQFSRIQKWRLDLAVEEFRDCRRYSDVIALLFSRWAMTESKPRWGDKTPHYVRHIPTLVKIFPNAQVLHIIRDPRAASRSWSMHPYGPGNVYSAASQWKNNVNAGRKAGSNLNQGAYMEIRYEQLLEDPSTTMESVFQFLGESMPDQLDKLNPLPESVLNPWRDASKTNVVKTRASAWREELSLSDIQLVESITKHLMDDLEFEMSGPVQKKIPLLRQRYWKTETYVLHYLRLLKRPKRAKDHGVLLWGKMRRLMLR